ncbi:SRPBCC family protein [Nonomuraea sp. LPB2021202275-12-8]|uniref:SRPBCC family protein n=1 Tax=Nonomuraea sp. LPB2021202275-12-8 TaxID=3120159 RepID=UPI00300DA218
MKFLLLIRVDPSVEVTPEESSPEAWVEEMDGRGVRLQGDPLRPAAESRSVRVRDGQVLVGDGPFAETKEQIGGFDLLECADLEEALEVAAKHPVARFGVVEVRQLDEDHVTGASTHVEVLTDATPEKVWDLITDVARLGEWSPECTGGTWLGGARGPAAGARFEGRNSFPNGDTSTVTCAVTAAERPARFAWDVLDGERIGSSWSYEVSAAGGRTRVRHSFAHGPGDSGLRKAAQRDPARAVAIVEDRLAQIRENMSKTLGAMLGS